VDPSAVEVGNGETATVVFAAGDALGDALVRPDRVVVHLVSGQDGGQVRLPKDDISADQRLVMCGLTTELADQGLRVACGVRFPR
jgi:hypothetical protein